MGRFHVEIIPIIGANNWEFTNMESLSENND